MIARVRLEHLDFGRLVHPIRNMVGLPLLEVKPNPLVRIIFLVRLVFVVLDLHEVAVLRSGIKGEGYKGVNGGRLRDPFERPSLWCVISAKLQSE